MIKDLLKISIKEILILMFICITLLLLSMQFIYTMAKSKCLEKEMQPVRVEYQGLFGVKVLIPTTAGNEDYYSRVCISTGEPNFYSISENINLIIKETKHD